MSNKESNQDILQLDQFFPYRLSQLHNAVSCNIAEEYKEYDLSRQQWRILAVLGDHNLSGSKQMLSAKRLGELTDLDKMQTSRAIDKLKESGRIEKTQDRNDRRSILIKLTEQGEALYKTLVPKVKNKSDQLLNALTTKQQEQLLVLMDKLVKQAGA